METMMDQVNLNFEQMIAADICARRILAGEPVTTLGGYAGTGKTTTVAEIVHRMRAGFPGKGIAFACYTGKAKGILASKLTRAGVLRAEDFCGTLHSLLMQASVSYSKDQDTGHVEKIVSFKDRDGDQDFACVIVDEASMVDGEMFRRIENLGVPVLAVGDHGQLPPVYGSFNLMENPLVSLNSIHRQADGDPIIRASVMAREDVDIPFRGDGERFLKTRDGAVLNAVDLAAEEWTLICGTNRKRRLLNQYVRERIGLPKDRPGPGDRIICLQNNHAKGIFNGMGGRIEKIDDDGPHWWMIAADMESEKYRGRVFKHQFGKEKTLTGTAPEAPEVHPDEFGDLFDYGYCMTAHKAQGSEWDNVVVYEEASMRAMLSGRGDAWRRWLYTAITRAKKRLIIVAN